MPTGSGGFDMGAQPAGAVRCVLFDIGGVLVRWDDAVAFDRVARRYRLDPARVTMVLEALRPGLQTGRLTLHEFWSSFSNAVGVPLPEDWRTLWVSELARKARPRRAVQLLAAELRRSGARTGLFSNTDPSHWRYFRSSGWLSGFSPTIPSFQIHVVKPDPRAFRRATRRLPAGAAPPIFIDDHPANVEAARRAGWDPLLFTTVHHLRDDLRVRELLV